MLRLLLALFLFAVSLPARAQSWLDRPVTMTNRQWIEQRLANLSTAFTNQPRVTIALTQGGGVEVNLYYATTRLLVRNTKERDQVLQSYVFEPVQRGLNEIARTLPPNIPPEQRPDLRANYNLHVLRTETGKYEKVATGAPGALQWDQEALGGFQKDLQGTDFSQGSLVARYELSEAQWLSMQLSIFSLQASDPQHDVRCVITRERRVACRLDARFERPKGGQAAAFYAKKRDELGKRIAQINEDLERLFEREGRETRFNPKAMLEWDVTFDEGEGQFQAGKFKGGGLSWVQGG